MRIPETHVAACFVILGGSAGLFGLLILGLLLLLLGNNPFSISRAVLACPPFVISGMYGWAAYSLVRRKPRAALIAATAWLLLAAVRVLVVWGYVMEEAQRVHCPETLLAVIVLVAMELLIALHFIQQRFESTT